MKNKEVFKVYVDSEGVFHKEAKEGREEIELAVQKPNHEIQVNGQAVFAKAVSDFAHKGVMFAVEVDSLMKKRNLWDDEKERKSKNLTKKINDGVLLLKRGGCKFSDAVKTAKQMIRDRAELLVMNIERNELSRHTAEALAENIRFDYLVSQCTVYNKDGKKFFESYEKYLEKPSSEEVVVDLASNALFKLTTGIGEDFRKDLPEYQFLLKHKLCDEKLRFLNRNGEFVDLDGKRVNEHGQWINDKNQIIDSEGNIIDDNVEFSEFIEDGV